jgi:DNA-binding CsgD family transcriptional regulator
MLGQLLPHLRRAMQLRHRLATSTVQAPPSLAALDALAAGVLVLDAEMHVLVANAAAEAMAGPDGALRLGPGSPGNGSGRTVARALHNGENAALAALVRATALQGSPGGAVPLRDADGWTVAAALVSPLPRRLAEARGTIAGRVAGQALVLLRALKPPGAAADPRQLRDIFGLTAAEAEVACALLGGATKETVAARRNLQVSTINTQVRAILEKTGAANLRDLERLLGGLFGR